MPTTLQSAHSRLHKLQGEADHQLCFFPTWQTGSRGRESVGCKHMQAAGLCVGRATRPGACALLFGLQISKQGERDRGAGEREVVVGVGRALVLGVVVVVVKVTTSEDREVIAVCC